jgi:drug/metabolite transporter (DMT)-like permease
MRVADLSLLTTLVGACFWGLSGTASQALFQDYNFPVLGLLTLRMLVAGSLLLLIKRPPQPASSEMPSLLAISMLGLMGDIPSGHPVI